MSLPGLDGVLQEATERVAPFADLVGRVVQGFERWMNRTQKRRIMEQGDTHPEQGKQGRTEGGEATVAEKEVIRRLGETGDELVDCVCGECHGKRREINGLQYVFL